MSRNVAAFSCCTKASKMAKYKVAARVISAIFYAFLPLQDREVVDRREDGKIPGRYIPLMTRWKMDH